MTPAEAMAVAPGAGSLITTSSASVSMIANSPMSPCGSPSTGIRLDHSRVWGSEPAGALHLGLGHLGGAWHRPPGEPVARPTQARVGRSRLGRRQQHRSYRSRLSGCQDARTLRLKAELFFTHSGPKPQRFRAFARGALQNGRYGMGKGPTGSDVLETKFVTLGMMPPDPVISTGRRRRRPEFRHDLRRHRGM
jgi:hypothetical protein